MPVQDGVDVRSDAIEASDTSSTGQTPVSRRTFLTLIAATLATLALPRWLARVAMAQSTTAPSTQPVESFPPDSPFRKTFTRLADPDPKVRDQARQDLMGLKSEDLPKLRQLVVEHLPLSPDQLAALRDIVMQAYLAEEKYRAGDNSSNTTGVETDSNGTEAPFFLGLRWDPEIIVASDARLGVTVDERLPGFPSYRFLRKGDMILGVWIHPTEPLPKQPDWLTPTDTALKDAIRTSPRTQDVIVQLIRNGQQMTVPIKMAPKPSDADASPDSLQTFKALRAQRAETYWQENFAPLFEQ
jgi:hypothetical protein